MNTETLARIRAARLMPVVVIDDASVALDLADTLLDAGLDVIEITFRTPAAAGAIATLAAQRPAMLVGAGTLLNAAQILQAADAGARFGLAPGFNPRTVEAAREADLDFAPGVATPSEVEAALSHGCRLLKLFPAAQLGGVSYLKALEGPYAHTGVQFIPTGGINLDNLGSYLALKSVAAIGGSWFVAPQLIATHDWTAINQLTRAALAAAGGPRGAGNPKS